MRGRIGRGLIVLLLALGGCGFQGKEKAIGYAYAGPTSLNLRSDLGLRTTTIVAVEHGERLEILESKRRFVRVRTPSGAIGWTDSAYLLTQSQMDDLNRLTARAQELPSEGAATVFDTLNVHTAASRTSPSFSQIEEGERIDVVAHRVSLRELPGGGTSADDWFLVRTKQNRAGWVLSRMVLMTVPDELAQYADRHYITAFQPLNDEATQWIWTTSAQSHQSFDFDSLRVFVFNPRKNSYDTVFTERNLKGHYPVEKRPDGFSAVVEEMDGTWVKRIYSFNGTKAKLLSKEPFTRPPALPEVAAPKAFDTTPPKAANWADKARSFAEWWFGF